MMIRKAYPLLLGTLLALSGCSKEHPDLDEGNALLILDIPAGFQYPNIPADNLPTQNRIDLGKQLFNDPILSLDTSISCASCHKTELAFTDGLRFSKGIDTMWAARNSMTLVNAAYQPTLFWDGGSPTLEHQAVAPIENPREMGFEINAAVARLQNHPTYPDLFQKAYGEAPSVYSLTRALACYERTLFSGVSRFDRFRYLGQQDALNESEIRGMNIFMGERGECFHCHGEPNFTDYTFQNNGLYLEYPDSGRARITFQSTDVGKFKVPSLRNVELTGPYMHDGSIATLEEVIDHYDMGGNPHPNRSGLLRPINMTAQEKADLLAFLKALTDE
jgi:cytochrome c peroxidase